MFNRVIGIDVDELTAINVEKFRALPRHLSFTAFGGQGAVERPSSLSL